MATNKNSTVDLADEDVPELKTEMKKMKRGTVLDTDSTENDEDQSGSENTSGTQKTKRGYHCLIPTL